MASTDDLIRQASAALTSENYAEALEIAEQAIAATPLNVDAYVFKGIALAQLDQPEEATRSFRRAIAIGPSSAKAYYNYATHLYQLGQLAEAKENIIQAVELQPGHAAAQDLLALLTEETKIEPEILPEVEAVQEVKPTPRETAHPCGEHVEPELQPISYRQPLPMGPVHTIPWIAKMGKAWPAIGWFISFTSLFNMIVAAGFGMKFLSDPQNKIGVGVFRHMYLDASKAMPFFVALALGLLLITSVWAILDVVDRGGREVVWVLVLFLSAIPWCVFSGLQWVVMPLYLLFGRKP